MHDRWQDQLPYYAAGTLDPAERAALETHLSGCEACRAALETWAAIAGAVREDSAARVEALPRLHLPDVFSRNGHSEAAPSLDGVPPKREQTENLPMTVHFPEIASLRPAPQSRSLLTLVAAVLLVVLFGAGAILLAQRIGDSGIADPGAPQGGQPAAPAAQAETPTVPPTSPTPQQMSPQQQMTMAALLEAHRKTQTAPSDGRQPLPPTIAPPIPTPIMVQPGISPMTPGTSSSITSAPLDLGLPPRAEIEDVRFEAQTWNNSGPAALAMALSALVWEGNYAEAAEWLRADADDRSVMLWEMVLFVEHETEYGALHRVRGVPALLKRLVAYGFPVVIPVGMELDDGEWYGHHWLVAGYDDEAQVFLVYDSFLGAGEDAPREVPYGELEAAWRQFNRAFMIVYRPDDRAEALDELVQYADREHLRVLGPSVADGYRMQHPDDPWAWFNVGAAWAELGFYPDAVAAFDEAFALGLPWRALWYRSEPYVAYYGAGRLNKVLELANEQSQAGFFEEAAYWRGMVYAAQELPDLARREFAEVLDANPNYLPAQVALNQLTLFELGMPVFQAGGRYVFDAPPGRSYIELQQGYVAPTPELAVPGTVVLPATPTLDAPQSFMTPLEPMPPLDAPDAEAPPPIVVTVVATPEINPTPTPVAAN